MFSEVARERRPVGDHVVEPRPDDAARHGPHGDLAGERRIPAAQRQLPARDQDRDEDPGGEQDPVPARRERAEMEDERIRRARDRGQQHASKISASRWGRSGGSCARGGLVPNLAVLLIVRLN